MVFRGLVLVWMFSFLGLAIIGEREADLELGAHTALIEVQGVVADDAEASADNVISAMRKAFKNKNAAGVILRINSPGGSPVQAGYINDEIIRLRNKYPDKPLYAVITDICASGGYYIAAAADQIYADKASLVGSIGVIMNGFGFTGTMDKLGIERRLLTAGEHKGFLDPFSPLNNEEVAHMQKQIDNLHMQFIDVVKNGRGDRLADDEKLFSGYIWSGEKSVELGLVDALGSSSYVAREILGEEKIVDYTIRPTFIDRFAERLGASMGKSIAVSLGLDESQKLK
jgi:protease-4